MLSEEPPSAQSVLVARLRTVTGTDQDGDIIGPLNEMLAVCRDVVLLERKLGHTKPAPAAPKYDVPPPTSMDEAVRQGREIARQERARLVLGNQPVPHLPDLMAAQGIRIWMAPLPATTSGLFFTHPDTGHIIVVNDAERADRQLFSHAHEYCHALMDRDRMAVISRAEEKDPVEKRADAFAIHLLAPPAAVEEFLAGNTLYQDEQGSPTVVMLAARHFCTSFDAMLFQFADMRLVPRAEVDQYRAPTVKRDARRRVDALDPVRREPAVGNFAQWVLSVGAAATAKGIVTKSKFYQMAERAGADRQRAEALLRPTAAIGADFY